MLVERLSWGLLVLTTCAVAAIWLDPAQAWLHPELLGAPHRIWAMGTTTTADVLSSPLSYAWGSLCNRWRPLSDTTELVDTLARPYFVPLWGPHLSLTATSLPYAAAAPLLFAAVLRDYRLPTALVVVGTALFLANPGFLSTVIEYIRPAKRWVILLLLAAWLCALRHRETRRTRWLVALHAVLLGGILADEATLVLYPIVGLMFAPSLLVRASWPARLAFITAPVLGLAAFLLGAPRLLMAGGLCQSWALGADPSGGLPLAQMLGWPLSAGGAYVLLSTLSRAVLTSVGVPDWRGPLLVVGLLPYLLLVVWLALVTRRRRWCSRHTEVALALAAFLLYAAYAALIHAVGFGAWSEPEYLLSLLYYYGSSLGPFVLLVVLLALRDAPVRLILPPAAVAVVAALVLFAVTNRAVELMHYAPYDASALHASLLTLRDGPQTGEHEIVFHQRDPAALDAEYARHLDYLLGPRWRSPGYRSNWTDVYARTRGNPTATSGGELWKLAKAYYPWLSPRVVVEPADPLHAGP